MTLTEAQTLRAATLAAYTSAIASGVKGYGVNERSVTRLTPDELMKQLGNLDMLIQRLQGGGVCVAQFRDPE